MKAYMQKQLNFRELRNTFLFFLIDSGIVTPKWVGQLETFSQIIPLPCQEISADQCTYDLVAEWIASSGAEGRRVT